jgi:hypothetical protein
MPRGVYPHTSPKQKAQARLALALGRTPAVRAKAAVTLKANAQSETWRETVAEATRLAMQRPEVQERHAKGIQRAREEGRLLQAKDRHGNGSPPSEVVMMIAALLEPKGFVRELAIPMSSLSMPGLPTAYKVDFGHLEKRIAVEVDGPYHHKRRQRRLDHKKTLALQALGWTVLRISHK